MIRRSVSFLALLGFIAISGPPALAQATQLAAPAPAASASAEPWPREITLGGSTATVFQPQLEKWKGNQLEFRMAVAASGAERRG